jgi:hypothetical protein
MLGNRLRQLTWKQIGEKNADGGKQDRKQTVGAIQDVDRESRFMEETRKQTGERTFGSRL